MTEAEQYDYDKLWEDWKKFKTRHAIDALINYCKGMDLLVMKLHDRIKVLESKGES